METSAVVERVTRNFNNELRTSLLETISEEEIPFCTPAERNEDRAITIFVSVDSKFNKKKKNVPPKLNIQFSVILDFDIQKIRKEKQAIMDLQFIWNIVKDTLYSDTRRNISYWSREMFRTVRKLYKNDYDLNLFLFPFEVCFDESDKLYVSRLPNFEDLMFLDPNDPKNNLLDNKEFIQKQAMSIIEISNKTYLFNNN